MSIKPTAITAMFLDSSKFREQILNQVPKEYLLKFFKKFTSDFREKIFKEFLKNLFGLPWQPEFLVKSNSVSKFYRRSPKKYFYKIALKLAQ